MNTFSLPDISELLDALRQQMPENFEPQLGLVTGSGLGSLVNDMTSAVCVPYHDLPLWPACSVKGHSGQLIFGSLAGVDVIAMQGRIHWYEGHLQESFLIMPQVLQALGCKQLILTNASGALNKAYEVGHVVMITDHINLQCVNPLIGLQGGPRTTFVGMDQAYSGAMRQQLSDCADALGCVLHEGVYCGVQGPNFETPAEIRAFRMLGADLVGMSTVPEVIAARYIGLEVAALSVISNLAAGLSPEQQLSHEVTLAGVQQGSERLKGLIVSYCASLAST